MTETTKNKIIELRTQINSLKENFEELIKTPESIDVFALIHGTMWDLSYIIGMVNNILNENER